MEGNMSVKEAEDDNILVTIRAEDATPLDFDGDDVLEIGKNVKITYSEASKPKDGHYAIAQILEKENKDYEMKESHKDGKKEDSVKADTVEKEAREISKKAESGDKEKDILKKGPSSNEVSGQAKSSSKESKERMTKEVPVALVAAVEAQIEISGLVDFLLIPKAADLKNLFGKYGKVFSAKVVKNA